MLLRLTHAFCLQRSGPAWPGPTGTSVYTASPARLGGPIFTPRCLPKKTSCRGLSHKAHHTENHTFCLSPPPVRLHAAATHTHHIKNTASAWNIPAEAACGVSAPDSEVFDVVSSLLRRPYAAKGQEVTDSFLKKNCHQLMLLSYHAFLAFVSSWQVDLLACHPDG